MEDKNIYTIEMEKRVVDIKNNINYSAEINGTPAALDLFTRAEGFLTESLDWQQKLEKSTKSYTVAGIEIKAAAATEFNITATVMSSYGVKIGNSDLIGLKSYTYSKLNHEGAVAQLADCNYILALIAAHSAGLADYKIDAAYTLRLVELVKKLDELTKLPQDVLKQHANDKKQYDDLERKIKKFYDTEMDPFMKVYRIANINLFLAYTAARKVRHHNMKRKPIVVDPEITTGILELLVLNKESMEAAAGVGFVVTALNVSGSTDGDGEIYTDGIVPGVYHGKLFFDGYKDVEFDFTIVAGKTCGMQFLMEKV